MVNRGFDVSVNTFFKEGLGNSSCVNCGQCTVFCPTGALRERSETDEVWDAILDPEKIVVVQEAPSIRVTLAEEFGMEMGTVTVGKMYAALKKLGFDYVFDTNFTADLTIMEEGTELIERVKSGGLLPLITSCSPGWIKFMETYFPDFAGHTSTCKSPQQMFGALVKTYFAKEKGLDPAKIVSVSIMPCTAKKFEARRPEMNDSGFRDVDYVLTTRELVRMIKEARIDFKNLPDESPDDLMGQLHRSGHDLRCHRRRHGGGHPFGLFPAGRQEPRQPGCHCRPRPARDQGGRADHTGPGLGRPDGQGGRGPRPG